LSRTASPAVRWPAIPLYEFERGSEQTGTGPEDTDNPPGDLSFPYKDLCLEVIDYGVQDNGRLRIRGGGSVANQRYCPANSYRTLPNSRRDDGLRTAIPADPNFPTLQLRAEVANPGRLFNPASQSIDVELYNPAYFRQGAACQFVPAPRPCFEPIYLNGSLDTGDPPYDSRRRFDRTYANVVSDDIQGQWARSAVFGFPPVYFNPTQVKPAIEYILFDEWQLPRKPLTQARLDEGAGSR
jgi:hypothetical protein